MTSRQSLTDTIAAIATPAGMGGLGVVRVSGPEVIKLVAPCLQLNKPPSPFVATYTHFIDPGENNDVIDEVVVTFFQQPKSYTAEDVIELSCHGGYYIARSILQILLSRGARMAEPGEFTKRAFLNGRIDLTQAEAVSDLINAQTASSHKMALKQLRGQLTNKVSSIRQSLINTISLLELELDFSEAEIDKTPYIQIEKQVKQIKQNCETLVQSYDEGRIYHQGIFAPIIGRPNVGKSSILNALLKQDRALVSEIAGTTRDTIEEAISHKGVEIRLVDTAGLRESDDVIESMGISRTEKTIADADVLLHVVDVTQEPPEPFKGNETPVIKIINKVDLIDSPKDILTEGKLYTSAVTQEGIEKIGDAIIETVLGKHKSTKTGDSVVVTNERHRNALVAARDSLNQALLSIENRISSEFIILDLRAALDSLGALTGETTTEDILNNIFEHFCIGK